MREMSGLLGLLGLLVLLGLLGLLELLVAYPLGQWHTPKLQWHT